MLSVGQADIYDLFAFIYSKVCNPDSSASVSVKVPWQILSTSFDLFIHDWMRCLTNQIVVTLCLQQPMYEPSALNRQQYTTTSYQKSTYSSYTSQGLPPGQFTPPAQMNPPPPLKPMTPLSNNLSELDMLLQDLSSAQFMAEVDRRNQGNSTQSAPSLVHRQSRFCHCRKMNWMGLVLCHVIYFATGRQSKWPQAAVSVVKQTPQFCPVREGASVKNKVVITFCHFSDWLCQTLFSFFTRISWRAGQRSLSNFTPSLATAKNQQIRGQAYSGLTAQLCR